MGRVKIFICYCDQDKKIAGSLKIVLEYTLGFEVFVAHDDIEASEIWEKKIKKQLKDTDYVIPLISSNFLNSAFANQEAGMAFAWGKKIIPIKLDTVNPPA